MGVSGVGQKIYCKNDKDSGGETSIGVVVTCESPLVLGLKSGTIRNK